MEPIITVDIRDDEDEIEVVIDGCIVPTYQVFSSSTEDYKEIEPEASNVIALASCFSESPVDNIWRAVECLNFAAAYGEKGTDRIGLFG